MPAIGTRAAHTCYECREPMVWTTGGIRLPDPLAGTSKGMAGGGERADGYRCQNAHTNPPCPVCQSCDTDVWGKSTNPPQLNASCNACQNQFVHTLI